MDTQKQKVSRKFLKSEIERLENEVSELKEFNTTVIANNYLKFQQIELLKKEFNKIKLVLEDRNCTLKKLTDKNIWLKLKTEKKERNRSILNWIFLICAASGYLFLSIYIMINS